MKESSYGGVLTWRDSSPLLTTWKWKKKLNA